MKPEEFTADLHKELERNLAYYKEIFYQTKLEDVIDDYWYKAIVFFRSLNPDQQEVLLEIIKQVQIDTMATMLGIIDGIASLNKVFKDVSLIVDGEKINGDLLEYFLEQDNS